MDPRSIVFFGSGSIEHWVDYWKRVLGIMAAILTAMHMRTAGDLFGTPSGSPETDKLIPASVQ